MKNLSLVIVFALLVGCSATGLSLVDTRSAVVAYSEKPLKEVERCLVEYTATGRVGNRLPWDFTIYTQNYREGSTIMGTPPFLLILEETDYKFYKTKIDFKSQAAEATWEHFPFMKYIRACSDTVSKTYQESQVDSSRFKSLERYKGNKKPN